MLTKPPIEELLPKAESRYTLAMLVAKRARQLVDGAQPMVEAEGPNLVTLACEEIVAGKVVGVPGIHSPVVPLRPEIEEARRLAREQAENQASMDAFIEPIINPPPAAEPEQGDELIAFLKSTEDNDDETNTDIADETDTTDVADVTDVSEEDIEDLRALDGDDEVSDDKEISTDETEADEE